MESQAPDVMLIEPEWRERALLRAQLIEEGFEVVAIDRWPVPRPYRQPGTKPRLLIVDLQGLPRPRETLDEARFIFPPDRVLVVTALGTLMPGEVRRLGCPVIERPATVGRIVATAAALVAAMQTDSGTPHVRPPNSHTVGG